MATTITRSEPYSRQSDGIYRPDQSVSHRDDEYNSNGFDAMLDLQSRHFWYLGRYRYLYRSFRNELRKRVGNPKIQAVDLGGGCGGWVRYLAEQPVAPFRQVALADSSLRALTLARTVVATNVKCYQIDLLRLQWNERWDVAFLLDVLEHIPQDTDALREIAGGLKPGGLLFVTTPAIQLFWSYNDDLAHHVRRYSRRDFSRLAAESGLELQYSRYFMFFLSPLLLLSRIRAPDMENMTQEQSQEHLRKTHRVPIAPVNQLLRLIFSLETPVGLRIPFPWGTSILGVFRKPC